MHMRKPTTIYLLFKKSNYQGELALKFKEAVNDTDFSSWNHSG